jgi:uncharacterized membrane protein YhaH (DUF805 family)
MHGYLQALRKYAVFSGRARRAEYWQFTIVNIIISLVLSLLLSLLRSLGAGAGVQLALSLFASLYSLAMILPSLAVTVRRLHDTDHSGWWLFISLVPIIGSIALFVWMVSDSDGGDNYYGRNPKMMAYSDAPLAIVETPGTGRRKARWWLPVGIVVALGVVVSGAFLYWVYRGTGEARALAPWPGASAAAEEVASVDLTPLGLQMTGKRDTRAMYGSDAPFVDGAAIEYGVEGTPWAVVAALRYPSTEDAGNHFAVLQGWAQGNCPMSTYANWGGAGVIRCGYGGGHDRILWNGNWILDIEAADLGDLPASDLTDQIRDATAAHWQGLSGGGP